MYGCVRVAQKQSNFNDELTDLNRVLENYNARGTVVTQGMIVEAVQELADEAGVSVDASEIVVTADAIHVQRHPYGGCIVDRWPDSVRFLPHFSYQRLLKLKRSCAVPRWIIGVRVKRRCGGALPRSSSSSSTTRPCSASTTSSERRGARRTPGRDARPRGPALPAEGPPHACSPRVFMPS